MGKERYQTPTSVIDGTRAAIADDFEILAAPAAGKKIVVTGVLVSYDPSGAGINVRVHFSAAGSDRTITRGRLGAGGGIVFPFTDDLAGDEGDGIEIDTDNGTSLDYWVQYFVMNV